MIPVEISFFIPITISSLIFHGTGCTKLSAIQVDVLSKPFFERLYLFLGLSPFEPRVNCHYTRPILSVLYSHTTTAQSTAISWFLCNFFPRWHLLSAHDSPSNLSGLVPVPSPWVGRCNARPYSNLVNECFTFIELPRGYQDTLLETARQAPTIVAQGGPS